MPNIDELKAQHGTIFELTASGESFIAKPPARDVWKRFRAQVMDEGKRIVAMENLVRGCIVSPTGPELDSVFDRLPGLVETLGKKLVEEAGAGGEAEKKAL